MGTYNFFARDAKRNPLRRAGIEPADRSLRRRSRGSTARGERSRQDLNLRPRASEARALNPPELREQKGWGGTEVGRGLVAIHFGHLQVHQACVEGRRLGTIR